jgi:hypothetical protein
VTRHLIPCDRCRPGRLLPSEAAVSRRAYGECVCAGCRAAECGPWYPDEVPVIEPVGDYLLTLLERREL